MVDFPYDENEPAVNPPLSVVLAVGADQRSGAQGTEGGLSWLRPKFRLQVIPQQTDRSCSTSSRQQQQRQHFTSFF